ncbi:C40 family peptidase [Sphingobacterium paludis]|uniref:Cell wall-associated NlpC family hydrolase n=1 Tax=Sphingobacterium paludis TaxID=1476465 RepID=A0A4R7D0J5_9SPHI|nr:C40 family peptidase [Sphingobacterium paludis]TDS13015.1 cell wall-associated NlpC family hydrolase [Sphingobacterium paludis]
MVLGICNLSVVPLRSDPSHRSEMVNQVLFAEIFELLEERSEWTYIRMLESDYEGWLQHGQYRIWGGEIPSFDDDAYRVVDCSGAEAISDQNSIRLVPGTKIWDTLSLTLPNSSPAPYHIQGGLRNPTVADFAMELPKLVNLYHACPYLWGGRSPYGLDCSGLTQAIYAQFGITLRRDAYQQAEQGRTVDFVAEIKPGDLAFFDNEEGRITHVGLMLDADRIFHASAYVRTDNMDSEGIFNPSEGRYTHKLRIVKRIL